MAEDAREIGGMSHTWEYPSSGRDIASQTLPHTQLVNEGEAIVESRFKDKTDGNK